MCSRGTTEDIRPEPRCDPTDMDLSGARRRDDKAPEWWLAGIDSSILPVVRESLGEEICDGEAESGDRTYTVDEESEEDVARQRIAIDPGQPTLEEVEEHRVTHHPYRSWCEHCVRSRGVGAPHKAHPTGTVPIVSCDYLLVTKKGIFTVDELEAEEDLSLIHI